MVGHLSKSSTGLRTGRFGWLGSATVGSGWVGLDKLCQIVSIIGSGLFGAIQFSQVDRVYSDRFEPGGDWSDKIGKESRGSGRVKSSRVELARVS